MAGGRLTLPTPLLFRPLPFPLRGNEQSHQVNCILLIRVHILTKIVVHFQV